MNLGTAYPMTARWDASGVRAFAREAEATGFDFVTQSGHVLSTAGGLYPQKPARSYVGPYFDPFTLFSHLAGITEHLRFRTSVLILPLYPTVLVAKQVAELSLLSDARIELGVSISWNDREYRAFGQDVHQRGRRLDEQLHVLKELWTNDVVSFSGEFHELDEVGIGRLPAEVPPVWLGGSVIEPNVARMAEFGTGWIPGGGDPTSELDALRDQLKAAGRDPDTFCVSAKIDLTRAGPDEWAEQARAFKDAGASHTVLDPGDTETAPEAIALIQKAIVTVRGHLKA